MKMEIMGRFNPREENVDWEGVSRKDKGLLNCWPVRYYRVLRVKKSVLVNLLVNNGVTPDPAWPKTTVALHVVQMLEERLRPLEDSQPEIHPPEGSAPDLQQQEADEPPTLTPGDSWWSEILVYGSMLLFCAYLAFKSLVHWV